MPYFIADWEHWLGDWEHLEPMMQQLYSFLLFCCCDDKSIHATFKPSYISKYMLSFQVIINPVLMTKKLHLFQAPFEEQWAIAFSGLVTSARIRD